MSCQHCYQLGTIRHFSAVSVTNGITFLITKTIVLAFYLILCYDCYSIAHRTPRARPDSRITVSARLACDIASILTNILIIVY